MQAKIATTSVDDDFTGNEWEFQLSIISANQARATHSIESDTEIKTRLLQLSVFQTQGKLTFSNATTSVPNQMTFVRKTFL